MKPGLHPTLSNSWCCGLQGPYAKADLGRQKVLDMSTKCVCCGVHRPRVPEENQAVPPCPAVSSNGCHGSTVV